MRAWVFSITKNKKKLTKPFNFINNYNKSNCNFRKSCPSVRNPDFYYPMYTQNKNKLLMQQYSETGQIAYILIAVDLLYHNLFIFFFRANILVYSGSSCRDVQESCPMSHATSYTTNVAPPM